MKILVSGDRNWSNYSSIERALTDCLLENEKLPGECLLIHGGARGADTLAGMAANRLGLRVKVYKAQWSEFGRAAGPIRNQQMLDEGKPDILIYFHPNLEESKGTADMVKRARKAGIRVEGFDK